MSRALAFALAASLTFACPVAAEAPNLLKASDGYLYFNRPNASIAEHDSELKNCIATWRGGVVVNQTAENTGLVQSLMLGGWDRARFAVNVEHCMVVRGWRVVRLPDQEGKSLAALTRLELADRLAPWVGADTPHGEIARAWNNDAARPDTVMQGSPQGARQHQLSIDAMDPSAADPLKRVEAMAYVWSGRKPSFKPLSAAELAAPPPGLAILVVQISRTPGDRRQAFGFDLEGGVGGQMGTEEFFEVAPGRGQADIIQAYAVPAGRWRLFGFGALFDYCMGAPSTTVRPGEVVFLGKFTMPPDGMVVDLSLVPARAFLSINPALAGRVRAAAWTNGDTYPCRFWHPYALELPGFPYEPGYKWGRLAQTSQRQPR